MTPTKILSLFLSFCLILEQGVFAQTIDLSHYFARNSVSAVTRSDKFRPLHLRYVSYDNQANDFKILLDKGDFLNQQTPQLPNSSTPKLEEATQELMKYFFIGLALPNEKFWVNLRPDSPDNILDPDLEKTDIGRIFLEADLQLKKDTSGMTSPQTKEGKEYWDKLYKKAGELFGSENIAVPTLTRPWIVPDEVIIRESPEGAYIYKATLKVMLEEDYLTSRGGSRTAPTYQQSAFSDPRLKELNEYSTQLIKENIIPKLTKEINSARRYAPLRQVYYSLILAQWFKEKYSSLGIARAPGISAPVNSYINLIDSGNLANLASSQPYDKQGYFQQYQKSFKDGEYHLQEPVYTPMGQSIRRYVSGGMIFSSSAIQNVTETIVAGKANFMRSLLLKILPFILVSGLYISSSFGIGTIKYEGFYKPHYYVNGINFKDNLGVFVKWKGIPEISEKEWEEIMLRLKNDNRSKDLTQDDVGVDVDVTSVELWARSKKALSAGKVVLKNVLLLSGRQEAVLYFVESYDALGGEAIEDKIIIKLSTLRNQIEMIKNKVVNFSGDSELFRKIYAITTERQLAISEISDAIYHEAIHVLTMDDIGNGKINREYMEEIFKKYGVLQYERYAVTSELVAYLGQLSSGKFPKRLLWEIFVQSSQDKKYRTCFEIITGELIEKRLGYEWGASNVNRRDFIESLPDEAIKSFSNRLYYEIMGINPPRRVFLAGLEYLLEEIVAKYDDNVPMLKKSGSSPMQNSSASSAVINEKIQRCIDEMAKVIFDQETGEPKNGFPLENISPGVTIEKLTGGNRNNPVYKLSAGSENVAVKFFNLKQTYKRADFVAEKKGLKIGEEVSLFQQYIDSKEYEDMSVGCIVTEFIPGKSFSAGYESWGLFKFQERLKEYLGELAPEINKIPPEHWEQLVEIYLIADKKGITLDVSPENFKYHPERGFVALDYYLRGSGLRFSHDPVENNVVEIVTGIKEHMIGTDNKLVKLIKEKIAEATKAVNKKIKKGGIDLSRINKSIRAESVASSGAGNGSIPVDVDFDVNEELGRLQNMINAQIIPSASRLDRYARAARASLASSPESADSALSLIAETFRLQEEKSVSAPAELKALAAWLEQAG